MAGRMVLFLVMKSFSPRLILWLGLVAMSAPVMAQPNHQRSYPRQSREFQILRSLHIEQGMALPFSSGPFSEAELRHALDRLEPATLSPGGQESFQWLTEQFRQHQERGYQEEDGRLRIAAQTVISLEAYLHTDRDNPFLEYTWEDRQPILRFPIEAWIGDGAYGIFDLDVRKNIPDFRRYEPLPGNRQIRTDEEDPWTNIPIDPLTLDTQFPHRAFMSFGGDRWNVQLGRDILDWGNTHTGNLYISDYADWHDFVRLTTFWDRFKFSFAWVSLDPYLADDEIEYTTTPGRNGTDVLTPPAPHKHLITQRWETRLWGRLGLAYTEGIFLGGEAPDLRHINPVYHFHNLYTNVRKVGNAHRSFDFDIVITPGLVFYAGITPGQYTSPTLEPDTEITSEPNAYAAMAGLEWIRGIGPGLGHGVFEAVYSSPWMYIHNNTLTSMTTRRFVLAHHATSSQVYYDKPIGHPGGNDHVQFHMDIAYQRTGMYRYGFSTSVRGDGERRINDLLEPRIDRNRPNADTTRRGGPQTESEARAIAPSGDHPQWTVATTLHGEIEPWFLPGFNGLSRAQRNQSSRRLSVGSVLSGQWMKNRMNQPSDWEFDLQFIISGSLTL